MQMLFHWCYITDNYYIFRRWLKVYLNFSYPRNIFYSDHAILSLWKKRFIMMDILQKKNIILKDTTYDVVEIFMHL